MTGQPATYRRRPAAIEAIQWTDTNAAALTAFAGQRFMTIDPEDRVDDLNATASLLESAHESWALLVPGDWVVKRGDDFEALTAEEFADLYEAQPGDRTNLVAVAAAPAHLTRVLAAHTDSLAATIESLAEIAVNSLQPGMERTLSFLKLYKEQLLAGQWTPEMRRLLGKLADDTGQQPDPDCEHCDGTGLDPDRYTEQPDGNGGVRYHAEPCSECQPEDGAPPAAVPAGDQTAPCRCHSRVGLTPEQHENDCPLAVLPDTSRAAVLLEVADRLTAKADALDQDVHDLSFLAVKARLLEAEVLDREADELRRMADEAQPEPDTTFFQPGHTYTCLSDSAVQWTFKVAAVTESPVGDRAALGFLKGVNFGAGVWTPHGELDFSGWTEAAPGWDGAQQS